MAADAAPSEAPRRAMELPAQHGPAVWLADNAAGVLKVVLERASKVLAMDRGGTSDPYAVILCGGAREKSKVVYKTLDPVWNQTFELKGQLSDFCQKQPGLHLKFYDRDLLSQDDPLGEVWVNLDKVKEKGHHEYCEHLHEMGSLKGPLPRSRAGSTARRPRCPSGAVRFTVTWLARGKISAHAKAAPPPPPPPPPPVVSKDELVGDLTLGILQAHNVPIEVKSTSAVTLTVCVEHKTIGFKKCKPVKVKHFGGKEKSKATVVSPTWDAALRLSGKWGALAQHGFQIRVEMGKNECVAVARVPGRDDAGFDEFGLTDDLLNGAETAFPPMRLFGMGEAKACKAMPTTAPLGAFTQAHVSQRVKVERNRIGWESRPNFTSYVTVTFAEGHEAASSEMVIDQVDEAYRGWVALVDQRSGRRLTFQNPDRPDKPTIFYQLQWHGHARRPSHRTRRRRADRCGGGARGRLTGRGALLV